MFVRQLDKVRKALATVDRELGDVVAELRVMKIAAPPKGAITMTARDDAALTGLPGRLVLGYDVDKWKVKGSFEPLLVPRLPHLPVKLRFHESAFAKQFADDVRGTVKSYRKLVGDSNVYSVDLAKRCYEPWGSEKKAQTDDEKHVRATANLALHQTAVAIAKVAFLQRLDELAELPADDPTRRVLVTAGGSGAGKGRIMPLLAVSMAKFTPGAVFDAAGEGEARECAFILAECKRRGLHVDFVYLHKPMRATAVRVIERTTTSGRMVDILTMVRGHLKGAEVMAAFADSSALAAQQKLGKARCYGLTAGDEVLDPDPMALKFAYAERLDVDGRLKVPIPELTEAQAVLTSLLELAEARKKGLSEAAVRGALMGIAVVWPDYFDSLGLGLFARSKKAA